MIHFRELKLAFPDLILSIHGDENATFTHIAPLEAPTPGGLLFVSSEKDLEKAAKSQASGVIVSTRHWKQAQAQNWGTTVVLQSSNPGLAMAKILTQYFVTSIIETSPYRQHPTSIVADSAKIDPTAVIGPYAVIEDHVSIGAHCWVGAHSVIEVQTQIAADCRIHPHVWIGRGTQIGARCEIKSHATIGGEGYGYAHDANGKHFRIPQVGKVVIEDDVSIGSQCAIDRATLTETRIGRGTKIDNFVHIAHNCSVGQHNLFTAGLMIAGSSKVGSHVVTGGRVAITDHVQVTDQVHIAGLSGVANDITKPGAYGGYPLQPIKDALRTTATLVHLPRLRKQVARILKHLGLPEDE